MNVSVPSLGESNHRSFVALSPFFSFTLFRMTNGTKAVPFQNAAIPLFLRGPHQHASESRLIFRPFRFPSTVTAMYSGLKNSCDDAMISSAVTA